MTDTTTKPRLYVGTYAKYNNGSIAGEWVDLEQFDNAEDFYKYCKKLHKDEHDPEFMFQDFQDWPDGVESDEAMENAVRAEVMEAVSGYISSVLKGVPFPLNIALAAGGGALVSGLMGSAIGKVKKFKFEEGGLVGGQRHSAGGTMIEAEQGEFVMNRNAVNRIGVNTLNNMNQGGGGININISAPLVDDTIVDTIIPKIKEAVRRGADIGVS